MGARHLSRRVQYLEGVPAGISFPKFLKPRQISEVKDRKEKQPWRGWYDLIDEIVLEAGVTDPVGLSLLSALD